MVDIYLWLYHTDLWPEFYQLLDPIKNNIILHLGLCYDTQSNDIIDHANSNIPNLKITHHHNAGVDILPFITDFSNNQSKTELFLKLHTKKSTLLNTIQWRHILLNTLIGSDGYNFNSNIKHLYKKLNIGLLTHRGLLLKNQEHSNSNKIQEILNYYKIPNTSLKNKTFAAGTMFFGRSSLYEQFFNLNTIEYLTGLLEQETGHVRDIHQGKYCHSIERIFGYICEYSKYTLDWAKYQTIRIINPQAPKKILHLSITYSGFVFIEENLAACGTLLHRSTDSFTIEWHHLGKPVSRTYYQIKNNTFIGSDFHKNNS